MGCASRRNRTRKGVKSKIRLLRKGGTNKKNVGQKHSTKKTLTSRFKEYFDRPRTQKPSYYSRVREFFKPRTQKPSYYSRFRDYYFRQKTQTAPSSQNPAKSFSREFVDGVTLHRSNETVAKRNEIACPETWDWETGTCLSKEEFDCKQNIQSKWLPDTKKCMTLDDQIAEQKKQCEDNHDDWDDDRGECVRFEDAEDDEYFLN